MLRISAIELLNKHLSESSDEHVLVAARGGLELSFLSSVQKITVYGQGREMFFTELVVVAMVTPLPRVPRASWSVQPWPGGAGSRGPRRCYWPCL